MEGQGHRNVNEGTPTRVLSDIIDPFSTPFFRLYGKSRTFVYVNLLSVDGYFHFSELSIILAERNIDGWVKMLNQPDETLQNQLEIPNSTLIIFFTP